MVSACVVTLPIDISAQISDETSIGTSVTTSITQYHSNVVRGDLQEEVWFCSRDRDQETDTVTCCLSIVSFRGRANFVVECLEVECAPVTAMCCVNQQVWLGSEDGRITLYDGINHSESFSRYLSIKPDQGILFISHFTKLRQVRNFIHVLFVCTYMYTAT